MLIRIRDNMVKPMQTLGKFDQIHMTRKAAQTSTRIAEQQAELDAMAG